MTRSINVVSSDCSACALRSENCYKTKGDFHCLPNKGLNHMQKNELLKFTVMVLALNFLKIDRSEISFLNLMDHH